MAPSALLARRRGGWPYRQLTSPPASHGLSFGLALPLLAVAHPPRPSVAPGNDAKRAMTNRNTCASGAHRSWFGTAMPVPFARTVGLWHVKAAIATKQMRIAALEKQPTIVRS